MKKTMKKAMVASLACLSLSLGVVAATVVVTPASANGEVTPSYVTMVDGASVRYSPNAEDVYSGIRFEATVDSYYFDELEAGYTTGILVIPQSLLGENELTKNTPEVKDVSTIVWMEETETSKRFSAVIYKIPSEYYNTELTARAYIADAEGNVVEYAKSENVQTHSVAQVASRLLAQGKEDAYGQLKNFVSAAAPDFTVAETSVQVEPNASKTLTVTGAEGLTVVWGSSDNNVATVNNGVVTGVATGTAEITATLGTKTVTIPVTVETNAMVKGSTYQYSLFGAYAENLTTGEIEGCGYDAGTGELTFATNTLNQAFYVYLPRIDYTQYSKVTYNVKSSWWTNLGLGTNINPNFGMSAQGTIEITYDGAKLNAVMSLEQDYDNNGVYDHPVYAMQITDADVINGKKVGIPVRYQAGSDYLGLNISVPTFTPLATMEEGDTYADGLFGAKSYYAEHRKDGVVTQMTGAVSVPQIVDGQLQYSLSDEHISAGDSKYYKCYLPRVNYSNYGKVSFNWRTTDWAALGLWAEDRQEHRASSGVIVVTNNGDTLTVDLINQDNVNVKTMTVADKDVINGKDSIAVSLVKYAGGGHVAYISAPTFKGFGMSQGDTYANGTFGAYGYCDELGQALNVVVDNGELRMDYTTGEKYAYFYLPCVDYTKYQSVAFTVKGTDWMCVGLKAIKGDGDGGWNNIWCDPSTATITITNNGDGTLSVAMHVAHNGGTTFDYSVVVTDQDVINGKKAGIGIQCFGLAGHNPRVSVPTFTPIA